MITQKNLHPSDGASCYAVVSCRWGWSNNGFEVLEVTPDLTKAIASAESYSDYRGGKYGVGVFNSGGKQVYHASSIHGEKSLGSNWRIETFERVGAFVSNSFEIGEEPDMDEAKRRWEEAKRMETLYNKLTAEMNR